MPRAIRAAAIGSVLVLVLSACEMSVRFTTALEEDGSGTFAVGMALDAEARQTLEALAASTGDESNGIAPITELYDGLEAAGWAIERTEPAGGLALEASRAFSGPEDFGRVLDELRGARTTDGTGLAGVEFTLDVHGQRSFLRADAGVEGVLDTTGIQATGIGQQVIEGLRDRLRLEIRAELPGAISDVEGSGAVGEGVVVWRPSFGERSTFGATGSSLRVSNLLLTLAPALVLFGLLLWFLLGRKRPRHKTPERLMVLEPMVSANGHHADADASSNGSVNGSGPADRSPAEVDLTLPADGDALAEREND